jgi:hypothetical protein
LDPLGPIVTEEAVRRGCDTHVALGRRDLSSIQTGAVGYVGDVQTVTVPLPDGYDPDLFFELISGAPPGCGPSPPPVGLLLDDVHVD